MDYTHKIQVVLHEKTINLSQNLDFYLNAKREKTGIEDEWWNIGQIALLFGGQNCQF